MALGLGRAERAAESHLVPGGGFAAKVFQGADEPALFDAMTGKFESVRRFKPKASRSDSVEMFLVATGLKDAE